VTGSHRRPAYWVQSGAAAPSKWHLALCLALLLAGLGADSSLAQPRVLGYHAWWMTDAWKEYDLSLYDKVLFFEFAVDQEGRIAERHGWPDAWKPMIEAVHAAGGRVAPTFAILDPQVFSAVLGSSARRNRLKSSILTLVRAAGADGAHLNFEIFEASTPEARDGFVRLARELRSGLKDYRADAELTIFLPGFDHGEAYDEVALAEASDYLVIQGYDMHWLNAPTAGPVAPLTGWEGANWEGITARYASLGIDPQRLVMTVPYFGYEWPTESGNPGSPTSGEGVPITFETVDAARLPLIRVSARVRVGQHGLLRDPVSESPWYRYRGADGWYQGWFEDETSLRAKYGFVRNRGLGGVAVFLLGYDGGLLEPVLREELGRR
jgi:spore germination protein YaaH